MPGSIRKWLGRLGSGGQDAVDSAQDFEQSAEPICGCPDRALASVCGTIEGLTVRPRRTTPWLEAQVSDGTGSITLVWMGRQEVPGIEPGRRICVQGRVSIDQGERRIYNPIYTLL